MADRVDTEQSESRVHHHYVGDGEAEAEVVSRDITQVTVDSSTQKIQNESFFQCHHLYKVDFSRATSLDTIGQWAFYECRSLCEMILPLSLVYIGSYAYYECSNLVDLELPYGLEVISAAAFSCCRSLVNITIPSTVRQLRVGTFSHCEGLESVELPSKLESIASEAFGACSSLKNIAIPMDTKVASNAFRACNSLLKACHIGKEENLNDNSTQQNNEIIVCVLKERLLHHPLHKICYYQSNTSGSQPITLASESLMQFAMDRDPLGMMPLHILSIAAKPNWKYIHTALQLEGGADACLHARDSWGHTPFDYLARNRNVDSASWKETLAILFWKRVLQLGLKTWRVAMVQKIGKVDGSLAKERGQSFREIDSKLKNYEARDRSSILELCLWKHELNSTISEVESSSIEASRVICRLTCCAEVVVPNVLVFL
ncbi:unnamed protein product [Cylindrotheca closterium]|uniref:Uncharacterized protein n=1 Tax=Cylindrotheca closterium TaxID=2856 RepID=A0AAD2FU71_9STRA|nr:unnamed protein product [Cylindrotheca closterium]